MKSLLAALRFLTIIPFPALIRTEERDLTRSVWFFPIVGLLIGAIVGALDYGLLHLFPSLVAGVLIVVALLIISGGLHLDGLADTADGFFSSRPRERILEIMKDSRSGPMAVAAVVCVLSLKIAALASIIHEQRWAIILLMALAGRCALVIHLALLPYAKAEGGLGMVFKQSSSWQQALWALAVLGVTGWLTCAWAGLIASGSVTLVTLLFSAWCYRKIGGLTGDTLGAVCELTEIVPALVMTAWA
ncbi:MAG: adenosylcobinamide-GDP ribazoletransferase [Planctomycetota bacterium]